MIRSSLRPRSWTDWALILLAGVAAGSLGLRLAALIMAAIANPIGFVRWRVEFVVVGTVAFLLSWLWMVTATQFLRKVTHLEHQVRELEAFQSLAIAAGEAQEREIQELRYALTHLDAVPRR